MALGLLGTLVPILPGLALMWGSALVYGLVTGLDFTAWIALVLITAVTAVGLWLSVRIPVKRTSSAGVSAGSQLLAVGLAAIGFFVIPVAGVAVGFVGGIYATRFATTRDHRVAWDSTKQALIGMLQASVAQFTTGLVIVFIWVLWVLVS